MSDHLSKKWDIWAAGFLAPLIVLFSSFFFTGALDAYDEGMHFLNHAMFSAGKAPYVDYYPIFPPIWTYAHILVHKLFGGLVIVQRLWFVLQAALVAFTAFITLRVFSRSRAIPFIIFLFVVAFGLDAYWAPRWSGARLCLYFLFPLLFSAAVGQKKRPRSWSFLLGFYVGASNLYALDIGIILTLASAAMLFVTALSAPQGPFARGWLASLFALLSGFLLPLAAWSAYLAFNGVLSEYVYFYYYAYIFKMMPLSTKALSSGSFQLSNPRLLLVMLALSSLGALFVWLAVYKGIIRKSLSDGELTVAAAALLSCLSIASVIRAVSGAQYTMFALIPMLGWAGLAIDRLIVRTEAKRGRQNNWLAAAALLILGALSSVLFAEELKSKAVAAGETVQVVKMLAAGDPGLDDVGSELPALKGVYGSSYFDEYVRYLASHTRPGEAIWAFPMHVEMLPALADRHNATRFPIVVVLMGSPVYQDAYIAEIEKERPRYLLFNREAKIGILPLEPYFKPVFEYIYKNYIPDPDFPGGEYNPVWVRRDAAYAPPAFSR